MVLNYASVGEAFILGSDQIKNTQDEIAKLKALLIETNTPAIIQQPPPAVTQPPPVVIQPQPPVVKNESTFNDILSNLIQHPKFDDIVNNYIKDKYPNHTFVEKSTFGNDNDIIKFLLVCLFIYLILNLTFNLKV